MSKLVLITPTYNNELGIKAYLDRVLKVIDQLPIYKAQVLFIDDGSKDQTVQTIESEIKERHLSENQVKLIQLTRNFGSYNSFLAGLTFAEGDVFVYLHADLQDPPELILKMLDAYNKGVELVIANRIDRSDGGLFSNIYHWMVGKYGIKDIPKGGFDLMLFSNNVREQVVKISEKNTNIVYLISWLGFPYISIPYQREKRVHGTSQWKFWNKVQLFADTLFSFTQLPLLLIRLIGLFAIFTFFFQVYLLIAKFDDFSLSVFLISLVLILLEVIAEYIWRIHETVRSRPNFVIKPSYK